MSDYTEHLISMAGGDGEPDLDAIQRRVDRRRAMADDGSYRQTRTVCGEPSDSFSEHPRKVLTEASYHPSYLSHLEALADHVPALLAVVRSQQAKIERVEQLHYKGTAIPGQYYCNEDGENWPCMTIAALTATEGA